MTSLLQVRMTDLTVVLHSPVLRLDTLHGLISPPPLRQPTWVPAGRVRSVATRHTSTERTALLGVGVLVGTAGAFLVAALAVGYNQE